MNFKIPIVLVVFCLLTPRVAHGADAQLSDSDKNQLEQDQQSIRAIDSKKDISDYDAEFEKMAVTMRDRWATRNRDAYVQLVLELCRLIDSGRFGQTRKHGLARKYALAILEEPDTVSLETEIRLTGSIGSWPEGPDWADRRRVETKARLHAWKRLNDRIDPNWDSNDRPMMHPPTPKGLPSGVAPEAIQDPKLRAKYELAIEKNNAMAKRFSEQYGLRNQREVYAGRIERAIASSYSKPPLDSDELEKLMKTYMTDATFASQLRTAVSREIEEKARHDFELLPTTGPFRGHPSGVPLRTKKATRIR